jgi:hypothetical protein
VYGPCKCPSAQRQPALPQRRPWLMRVPRRVISGSPIRLARRRRRARSCRTVSDERSTSVLLAISAQVNRGAVDAPGQAPSTRSGSTDGSNQAGQVGQALVTQPRLALNRAAIGPLGWDHHRASRARAAKLQTPVRPLLALNPQPPARQRMERVSDHHTVRSQPVRAATSSMRRPSWCRPMWLIRLMRVCWPRVWSV